MIESSFIILDGVGEHTERKLWESGVSHWGAFLQAGQLPGISPGRKKLYDSEIEVALDHFSRGQARYFSSCLRPRDHWRLYQWIRPRTVYLDIETTGGSAVFGEVTVVGLFGRGHMTSLVRGESLTEDRLNEELSRYDLVVTFFGSVFDLPYLQCKFPGLVLDHPHVDLCFLAKRLGLRGGLKQIEPAAGITRPPSLDGLDGWDAVRLWHRCRRGDETARQLLLEYNAADARNLELLADYLYGCLSAQYRPAAVASPSS